MAFKFTLFLLCFAVSSFGQSTYHDQVESAKNLTTDDAIVELIKLSLEATYKDSLELGMLYYYLGGRHARLDSLNRAVQSYRVALTIFKNIGYKGYRLPRVLNNIADYYRSINDYNVSSEYYMEVIKSLGDDVDSYINGIYAVQSLSQIYRDQLLNSEQAEDVVLGFLQDDSISLVPPVNLAGLYIELGTTYTDYNALKYHQKAEEAFDTADSLYQVAYGEDYPLYQKLVLENQRIKLESIKNGYAKGLERYAEVLYSRDYAIEDHLDMGIVQTLYYNYCVSQVESNSNVNYPLDCNEIRTRLFVDLDHSTDLYFGIHIYAIRQLYDNNEVSQAIRVLDNLDSLIALGEVPINDGVRKVDLSFVRSLVYSRIDEALALGSGYDMVRTVDELITDSLSETSVVNAKNNLSGYLDVLIDIAIAVGEIEDVLFFAEKNREYSLLRALGGAPFIRSENNKSSSTTAVRLQKDLNKKKSIYYYHVGRDSVYLITIDYNNISMSTLGDTESVIGLVAEIQQDIVDRSGYINQRLASLHTILIGDNALPAEELLIVPDKELHFLPFETLVDKKGNYLIASSAISYTPSLGLHELWKKRGEYKVDSTYILSPDYSQSSLTYISSSTKSANNYSFNYLPYTKEEVAQLSKELRAEIEEGYSFNRQGVLSSIEAFDLFHFTGHAVVTQEDFRFSYLALGVSDEREVEAIYAMDLEQLNLSRSKMIMLNGCETGTGQFINGEGVFSLARSFFRAGASSIVNSLWQIDDKSSSMITVSFYQYLKEGLPKNKALQSAKLDYLESATTDQERHPYYWAGLVITGDVHPLSFSKSSSIMKVAGIGAGLLLMLFLVLSIKRS